jgi:hypothetical protein
MTSSRPQLAPSARESFVCDQTFEDWAQLLGHQHVAGIDEVGRGALFGPVCAAVVILDLDKLPVGIDDSKKLSPKQRELLAEKIRDTALDFSIAFVEARVIDEINILQATFEAMRQAISGLRRAPEFLLCDALISRAVPFLNGRSSKETRNPFPLLRLPFLRRLNVTGLFAASMQNIPATTLPATWDTAPKST